PRLMRAVALVLALAGCSTTGGTVGGLLPAPKMLKGTIETDTYRAPDGLFQVGCPQPKGSHEYKYMAVKELYGPKGDYVSFGPAAFDHLIRAYTGSISQDAQMTAAQQFPLDKLLS